MSDRLGRLSTGLGEKSTYDAVAQCSRCGYCEQACPTYVATGEEGLSPRGRNQALRLLLEGKLEDPQSAARFLDSCLLCGACSTACYAHVRVPDLVLEGRRLLRGRAPAAARLLSWLLLAHPRWLERLLGFAYVAKRLGLGRLAGRMGLMDLIGLPGLAVAEEHVAEVPRELLAPRLRSRPELADPAGARHLYFAPCGPNFVLPKVGAATVAVLQAKGKTAFLNNSCCGLLAFNYGELEDARALARRVIEEGEAGLAKADGEAVVIADCSSCAAHLKAYPQLFLEDAAWRPRAEAFAARVKDVAEWLSPAGSKAREVRTYHDSCRAKHGQGIFERPREVVRSAPGGFVELAEADACCGGAGAFAFLQPELSDQVLRRKISCIAATGATVVATSSTSCLLQLAHGLSKYYPECRVAHVSEIAAEGLANRPDEC